VRGKGGGAAASGHISQRMVQVAVGTGLCQRAEVLTSAFQPLGELWVPSGGLLKIRNKTKSIIRPHLLLPHPLEHFEGSLCQKIACCKHQRVSTKTGVFLDLHKSCFFESK